MIYDRVKNIKQYKGMSDHLDQAIEFLMTLDEAELKDGRNEIAGDDVYANVMSYETKELEDGIKEAHKRYIDIHYMLRGQEQVLVSDLRELDVTKAYSKEDDCALYKGEIKTACVLKDDYFVLCFPNDVHSPAIKIDQCESVKKMVIKVRV